MSYPVMPLGFLGSQGDNDTYRIERSLRFNSADSAYLKRTPSSSTNRKTWTWSSWIKKTTISSKGTIFCCRSGVSPDSATLYFQFDSDNTLYLATNFTPKPALRTTQLFRDTSAWYHLIVSIDTTDATASNRVKIYVNGTQITSFSTATYPDQNADLAINQNFEHQIGSYYTGSSYTELFDGYITEVYLIDGQALTPSSFGETDAITGRWKAKAYSGTYGTNGFYLKFADNSGTTATTLGKDSSPNGNNWTPNNFSVAGADNDSLVDSPTNYGMDTGVGGEVRGNYCIINASFNLNGGVTSDGNLVLTSQNAGGISAPNGTIGVKSGKWYFEMQAVSNGGFGQPYAGINNGSAYGRYTGNGSSSPFLTYGTYGVAFDVDAGKLWLTDSTGAWVSSGSPSTGANPLETFSGGLETFPYCAAARTSGNNASAIGRWNFGQRPFAYTAPTGFKALCTTNLPTPTIRKPSSAMDVVTYTGNGSARSITGLGFSPDLVWIKGRSGVTDHAIYDSVRGAQSDLISNTTGAATTQSQGLTAFNSDGFTIGTLAKLNTNTSTYVAWAWDRAAIDGLDIVSYSGNSSTQNVSHGLGVAPSMIIVKTYSPSVAAGEGNWCVYHRSLGSNKFVYLDLTNAAVTSTTIWNNTAPTASVFSLGNDNNVNKTGKTQIAYCFAEVEGFSRFGSYTGNLSSDGAFIWCGFRPRYIMVKGDSVSNWNVFDAVRGNVNPNQTILRSNLANSEIDGVSATAGVIDFLSNGFKMRGSYGDTNANSTTFIFAAFAESPFKYARAR